MRVSPRAFQSVVFVGAETERGFSPNGTGFIGILAVEDVALPFVITARHVLEQLAGDSFSIRLNRKDGSAETKKLSKENMLVSDDKAIDLAIIPAPIDASIYDVFALHFDRKKWSDRDRDIGTGWPAPGDEISITGLYTSHYGHIKNTPVVRTGHIAAIPEEKVLTDRGYVHGFLVEVHSIAGLSGSPVFWNIPPVKVVKEDLEYLPDILQIPIGIFIGYHVIESREDEMIVPELQPPPRFVGEETKAIKERSR